MYRRACDGPSYASVVTGTFFCYFETRAHTTEPTTGRHNCDGPSSGNRRVINDVSDPTRLDPFSKSEHLKSPTPHFTPITSLFLPLLFPSKLPQSIPLSTTDHCPLTILQSPKVLSTSGNCCCECLPCH